MNESWQTFLTTHGAIIESGHIVHYGNPAAELVAAGSGTILTDLSHFALIAFAGTDAQSFLQGQLSCDVRQTASGEFACYGSYCTPKGRVLASFLLWQEEGRYIMQLPTAMRAAIHQRLSMFVLRSQVMLSDGNAGTVCIGLAGPDAARLIRQTGGGIVPDSQQGITCNTGYRVIHLDQNRFMLAITPEKAPALWLQLREQATPAGTACWDWLTIRAGIPVITPATREEFVPQMVNLDSIGGISFEKGCYPGQEIVARTRYLGKIKRRMYRAHILSKLPLEAGDELFGDDMPEQATGMIVNAAPAPGGGYDVLAVLQTSSVESGCRLHGKTPQGPTLTLLPLPYPVT